MTRSQWTDGMLEEVRNYLTDRPDWSFQDIADRLNEDHGTRLTRNAVAGKIDRAGLRGPPRTPEKNGRSLRSQRRGGKSLKVNPARPSSPPTPPKPVVMPKPTGTFQHLDVLELEKGMCKFPHGDKKITFCGEPSGDDVYCKKHAKIARAK